MDLRERVYFSEINLDKLNFVKEKTKYKPIPIYPGIKRDLALLVPEDMQVVNLENIIRKVSGNLLKNLSVIDIYKGEKIKEGYKSITFSMFFVSEDYTLTDNEVDDIIKNILLNLSEIGVYLRQK